MLLALKPLSIQAKLRCIAAMLLLGMAVIGGTFWVALSRTQAVTEEVVKQTAVLSQLQSADMSHDGLRSVVYASFLVGQLTQVNAVQVRKDGRDHAQNMREAMVGVVAAVGTADVDPQLRAQLVAVAELVRRYLDTADALINTALTDRGAAQVALPIFDAQFSELQHAFEEAKPSRRPTDKRWSRPC
jgi:hypothetical protein